MLSSQLENAKTEVRIEKYLMTGIERIPDYFPEKCFYYVGLTFKRGRTTKRMPWIKVGNDKVDHEVINTIKNNLDNLVSYDVFTSVSQTYAYKDAKVKLVFFNGEIIAICNLEETKFLLTKNLTDNIISKKELKEYISNKTREALASILNEFTDDIGAISEFLSNKPEALEILSDEKACSMQDSLFKLESILQDRVSNTYANSSKTE